MKESKLFLDFIRRNFIFLGLPVFSGLLISLVVYSGQTAQTKLSQSFKLEYNLENVETVFALTDQAVTELRLQNFESHFPGSKTVIFKPGPLSLTIETYSKDKNTGYELLLKETEYLRQNFTVSTLTGLGLSIIEPNIFKYTLTGGLIGFLLGLIVSLIKEYRNNF